MSCNSYHYNDVSYHRRDHHPDLFKEKLLKKEDETLYLLLAGLYIMLSHVNYHKIDKTWYVCLDKHVFSIQKNVKMLMERFFNFLKGGFCLFWKLSSLMSAYELSINLYILQLTQYWSSLQVLLQKSSAAACLREAVGVQVWPHRHRLEVRTAHIPAVLRKSLETTVIVCSSAEI